MHRSISAANVKDRKLIHERRQRLVRAAMRRWELRRRKVAREGPDGDLVQFMLSSLGFDVANDGGHPSSD